MSDLSEIGDNRAGDVPVEVIKAAYEMADGMLRDVVKTAKTPQQFFNQLAFCQIMASHLLAVLVFNSFAQTQAKGKLGDRSLKDFLEHAIAGIRKELSACADAYDKGQMVEEKMEK